MITAQLGYWIGSNHSPGFLNLDGSWCDPHAAAPFSDDGHRALRGEAIACLWLSWGAASLKAGRAVGAVSAIPPAEFDSLADEELAAPITQKHTVSPFSLNLDDVKVIVQELPGGSALMDRKEISFTCDAMLFHKQPSKTSSEGWSAGDVNGRTLTVGADVQPSQADAAERHIRETIANVQQQIQWQANEIAVFNGSLSKEVQARVAERRSTLKQVDELRQRLNGN